MTQERESLTDARAFRRCSNCSGLGYIDRTTVCGRCKGSGAVRKGSKYAIPWDSERRPCPTCGTPNQRVEWAK